MNVDIANAPIPDGQILGLMASNNGHSCAHHHCCGSTAVKVGSVVFFFSLCDVLDKILQELEDAIQVTTDCDFHPEIQKCRVAYLSRRIAHNKVEAAQYVNHTAVVIEIRKDTL